MKKRLLSLVLCLVMVFSLFPSFAVPASAVEAGQTVADGTYKTTDTQDNFTVYSYYALPTYSNRGNWGPQVTFTGEVTLTVSNGVFSAATVDVLNWADYASSTRYNYRQTAANNSTYYDNGAHGSYESNTIPRVYNGVLAPSETEFNGGATYQGRKSAQICMTAMIGQPATLETVNQYFPVGTQQSMGLSSNMTECIDSYNAVRAEVLRLMQAAPKPEELGPGEEWIYTAVTTPEDGWKTDSDYGTQQLYARVDGEYVPVQLNQGTIYGKATDENGNVCTEWTAVDARAAYLRHGNSLLYWNGSSYEDVGVSKSQYYPRQTNLIDITDADVCDHTYLEGNWKTTNFYVYTPHDGDGPDTTPCWHRVYYKEDGYLANGYYYTFFYYKNSITGSGASFSSGSKGDVKGTGSRAVVLLNDYHSCACAGTHFGEAYGIKSGYSNFTNSTGNGTDGYLYKLSSNYSDYYNYLFTGSSSSSPTHVLACQEPNSYYSHDYNGYLYYSKNGVVQLLNKDTNVQLPDSNTSTEIGGLLYEYPLYTRTKGVKGDLVGYKHLSDRNADGSYDLMIDSWATGPIQGYTTTEAVPGTQPTTTVTETTVEKKVPLDVVLVIDQSGSMGTSDMGETITGHNQVAHTGDTWTEREINNGTEYYCKIGENDYRRVYNETGNVFTEADSKKGNKMFSFGHDGVSLVFNGSPVHFNVPTNYYVKYNGEMHKLYMITVGKDLEYGLYPYIYTDDNSTYAQKAEWSNGIYWVAIFRPWSAKLLKDDSTWSQAVSGIRWVNSNGETLDPTDSNGDSVKTEYRRLLGIGITDAYYIKNLYTVSNTATTALYYLDDSGNKVYISNTRTMGEDEFTLDTRKCDGNLYTAVSDSTRVQALRKAAETFTEALAQNAKENNVTHRMAIVGFAGNMFPSYSTGETAVHNTTTTREYTDTGVFLNNGFVNYGTMNASNAYTKVEGVTSTSGLYINKHYYIKDGDNYLPIAYDFSSARWYYTDNGAWLTSRNGSYRGTFYQVNLDAITATQYKNALVSVYDATDSVNYNYNDKAIVNTPNEVNDDLDHAIDNFGFYGGTYTSYGLAMANSILAQNTVGTGSQVTTTKVKVDGVYDETQTTTETEQGIPGQRIIVVFTDGEPGASGYDANIANEALAGGVQAKMSTDDNGYGAKVYTVGLYPNNVSSQVEKFMHQLSSEYTANIQAVDAVSDYAVASALNGNSTYYYKEADGKYYAVTASINGQSTLGWWEHNVADGSYSQLNVEGEKGSGEHPIYSDRNHQNQVFGENANQNTTYYSYDGDPVRFEYRWYDADRHIREPFLNVGSVGNLPEGARTDNRYQFYEITGQTANADGESYYTRVRTGQQLADAFTSIVNSIKITAETTVTAGTPETQATTQSVSYGAQNAMIRDVINAAFDIDPNAQIELQLIQSSGLSNTEITQDGKTFKLPNEGTQLGSGTGSMIYTYNSKTETIQAVRNGRTVDVTGFEFSDHYITAGHDGAFLRVIVRGLQPNGVGTLYSNTNAAAISSKKADNTPGDTFFSYNNPSVVVEDYTVTWVNGEQTLEKDEHVPFNAVPSYESGDPMRAPKTVDNGNGTISTTTYTFAGWSEDANASAAQVVNLANEKITKDTTYYAIFSETTTETRNAFTVKWNNVDLLEQDGNVAAGTVPEYNSAEPVNGNMVFVGWTTNSSDTTLTNQRIDDGNFPDNFAVQPNRPVEYYPADSAGVVNFYAVFMAKGQVTEATKKVVVEYSTKNLIDSGVYEFETDRSTAGTFIKEKTGETAIDSKGTVEYGDLFFVPKMQQTDSFAYDLTPMSSVSTAKYYTGASAEQWNVNKIHTTVTVVPGPNIYFDDSIASVTTSILPSEEVEKTFDYEAHLNETDVNNTAEPIEGGSQLTFTFTGTGIEVYAHTSTNSGKVGAYLYNSEGKIVKSQIMNNNSENIDLYNVPTIRFDVDYGTYKLLIIPNKSADYRLDGVRVFNPSTEKTAKYLNIRGQLLDQYKENQDVFGALFLVGNTSEASVSTYEKYGPKNEVYLDAGESVTFQVKGWTGGSYRVGLSAVSGGTINAAVSNGDNTTQPIAYTVEGKTHVFYTVKPADDGSVMIKNNNQTKGAILSITDLEIVGGEAAAIVEPELSTEAVQGPKLAATRSLMSYARSFDADAAQPLPEVETPQATAEPSPSVEPTPSAEPSNPTPTPTAAPSVQSIVRQLISSFVNALFNSVSRLFGGH